MPKNVDFITPFDNPKDFVEKHESKVIDAVPMLPGNGVQCTTEKGHTVIVQRQVEVGETIRYVMLGEPPMHYYAEVENEDSNPPVLATPKATPQATPEVVDVQSASAPEPEKTKMAAEDLAASFGEKVATPKKEEPVADTTPEPEPEKAKEPSKKKTRKRRSPKKKAAETPVEQAVEEISTKDLPPTQKDAIVVTDEQATETPEGDQQITITIPKGYKLSSLNLCFN
jgi:hypothetical protein